MKKQVLIIMSVALASFLMGTTFSGLALDTESPFAKIWQAISNLQGRVENLEESANGGSEFADFVNEITRVEYLGMRRLNMTGLYYYLYGVSGLWNISKVQTEPFKDKFLSIVNEEWGYACCFIYTTTHSGDMYTLPPNPLLDQGYERGLTVRIGRELSEAEVEAIRVLILEYLAKP